MDLRGFQEYFGQRGYQLSGKSAFGVESTYPVTVDFTSNKFWNIYVSVPVSEYSSYRKELDADLKGLGASALMNNAVALTLKPKGMALEEAYPLLISRTLETLRRHQVRPLTNCPVCGLEGCDTMVPYSNLLRPIHNACCDQVVMQANAEATRNAQEGNYFLGFLGALLGAIVGCIPSVLTIYFGERIFSLLFALIPICIFFGYKLFKGKQNKVSLVITILLSAFSVYLIQIILLIITVIADYGASFGEALEWVGFSLSEADTWSLMTQDSIQCFVFIALGIWIAWGYISRTAKSTAKDVQSRMAVRVPYGTAPAYAQATTAVVETEVVDVILKNTGENKISVIKVIREVTGLDLAQAKNIADNAPMPIKQSVAKSEAENIRTLMAGVGAEVEFR